MLGDGSGCSRTPAAVDAAAGGGVTEVFVQSGAEVVDGGGEGVAEFREGPQGRREVVFVRCRGCGIGGATAVDASDNGSRRWRGAGRDVVVDRLHPDAPLVDNVKEGEVDAKVVLLYLLMILRLPRTLLLGLLIMKMMLLRPWLGMTLSLLLLMVLLFHLLVVDSPSLPDDAPLRRREAAAVVVTRPAEGVRTLATRARTLVVSIAVVCIRAELEPLAGDGSRQGRVYGICCAR